MMSAQLRSTQAYIVDRFNKSNDTQIGRLSSETWKRRERSNVDDSVCSAIRTD
jgi:hypothetical protein